MEDNEILAPERGMTFDDDEAIYEFFKKYSRALGFPIKKRSSKRDKDTKVLKYLTYSCSRAGTTKSECSNPLNPPPNSKIGCKVKISATLESDGKWVITKVYLDHNHLLSPSKSRFFRCNRQIPNSVKRKLEINDKAGIRANKNFQALVVEFGGHDKLDFLEKDCRNYIDKMRSLRLGEGDAIAIQHYFLKMQAQNTGFFFSIDLDEDGRLINVFWADGRSRRAYKDFGEVITFDTTYLTNKYEMPFAPFVGVNHHGQPILFGCGLISNDTIETFVWLFRTWLTCMDNLPPQGIITDQDKAMKSAIETVFPNARHRWCLWHVLKKLPLKFGNHHRKSDISYELQRLVYDTQCAKEFEHGWSLMIENFGLQQHDWLTGLYEDRKRWVPCYVKNTFWAGMSTTQRSEGVNAFFDGYVGSKTSLKLFVESYETAVKNKAEKEALADFDSFTKMIPCVTKFHMEKQAQSAYTITKFKEF